MEPEYVENNPILLLENEGSNNQTNRKEGADKTSMRLK
jgi:hypothetical protein